MGEYAKRISDGTEVKIGTCESMYYLRYEDRDKVKPLAHSLDPRDSIGLFFRLPFPDEDDVHIGQYDPPERGLRLYREVKTPGNQPDGWEDFTDETAQQEPGNIQLRHESGLLLNVRCYHGCKLPAGGDDIKPFWNGKGHSLELAWVKATESGVLPIVRCRWCGMMWRYEWSDVIDYIHGEMRQRLAIHYDKVLSHA